MANAVHDNIFVDSNFLIALYNVSDNLHQGARELAKRVSDQGSSLYVSNYVLLEVLTVLSQKIDHPTAIKVGENLRNSGKITNVHIDEALNDQSWQIFQAIQAKNMSFVDCSHIAVMNYVGIKRLLSFDTTDFKPLQKQYNFALFR